MIHVVVPLKRVNLTLLKSELIAAGIPSWGGDIEEPSYVGNSLMSVALPDGVDPSIAEEVLLDHVDTRSEEQILKDMAKKMIEDLSAKGRRDRARDKLTVEAIQGVMAWCNALRLQLIGAGISLSLPPFQLRTWEQLEARVRELIDTTTVEEEAI